MQYSNFVEYEGNITNETCYNATLAAVGNSGISCGYYEIKKNNIDGTTTEEKTCFLFEEDIPKTKNMELGTKYLMDLFLYYMEQKKGLSNYQITASNSKGQYFVYDSSKDAIIDANDPSAPSDAKFISIKYLLLLILLLI